MTEIKTYKDVTFPFDTKFADHEGKVRLLACISNEYSTRLVGYSYYNDPLTDCSQVLDWDENGVFAGGAHPSMNLVPPPGAVESQKKALSEEIATIRQRLADNPGAPEAWRSSDEYRLAQLERSLVNLAAPHIWDRAA